MPQLIGTEKEPVLQDRQAERGAGRNRPQLQHRREAPRIEA